MTDDLQRDHERSGGGRALHDGFLRAAERHPDRPALEVDGQRYSYAALRDWARSIAATLAAARGPDGPPLTCVLGQRSAGCFAGVLGVLCSGHGYVPIQAGDPPARVAATIARSQARAIVADQDGARALAPVLARLEVPVRALLLDTEVDEDDERWADARARGHVIQGARQLLPASAWTRPTTDPDDIAYLLFTSGSTGQPKGVMVAHRNITRFLDVVIERYELGPQDRFSHLFELTFDLSLFDLFGAWSVGGCLCVPDRGHQLLPARYVDEAAISVWFSVPSTALLMKKTRTLGEGAFTGLRLVLFCGEALPTAVAAAFARAAPRAVVENLYGPTELTLACTVHRFEIDPLDPLDHEDARAAEVVPIGAPLPGMRALVVDDELRAVAPGARGELILAGPQVALGYWRDPERTRAAFVRPPGESEVFYRTGDRVELPRDGGPLRFLGRVDHQVKIRGYRVELGEVEAALRELAGVDAAVALGWPLAARGGAEGIVAFLDDASVDTAALLKRASERLPRYMIPRQIRLVEAFPLNTNGKIDRNKLRALLG